MNESAKEAKHGRIDGDYQMSALELMVYCRSSREEDPAYPRVRQEDDPF